MLDDLTKIPPPLIIMSSRVRGVDFRGWWVPTLALPIYGGKTMKVLIYALPDNERQYLILSHPRDSRPPVLIQGKDREQASQEARAVIREVASREFAHVGEERP